VRTAGDLLERHTAAESGGLCTSCGQPSPCASVRHATEVRRAAGLGGAGFNSGAFGELPTRRLPMDDQQTPRDDQQTPRTEREAEAARDGAADPARDDFDHLGHEEQEEVPGGTRGGGMPGSPLGR